jgi:VWFA-related protein
MRQIAPSLLFVYTVLLCVALLSHPAWAQRGVGVLSGPRPTSGNIYSSTDTPSLSAGKSHFHADDEGRVEFRSQTVLVQVPAVVTDKSGKHMLGLAREDFHVFENGKEQKISSFEEVSTVPSPLKPPPSKAGEFTNLDPAQSQAHSPIMVAFDTVNTPFLDQAYGRKQLINFLSEHMDASRPFGLVQISGNGLRVIHPLTSDPDVLIAALKKVNGAIPALQGIDIDSQAAAAASGIGFIPSEEGGSSDAGQLQQFVLNGDASIVRMQQNRAIEITMRAFIDIASSLAGIPGRKALIWATGSFPFLLDSYSAVPGGYLSLLYERALKGLSDAQVAVYPVDLRGLVNTSPAADITYSGGHSGRAFANSIRGRSWLLQSSIDTLRDFADMTGGRAFYNNNDVAAGFTRAADDSAQYYLLGYYLDTTNTKAGWRQLKVTTTKSGTEVRARAGFFVTNATANPQVSRQLDVETAIASPFDSTGLPITLKWTGLSAAGDKRKADFNIHLAPGSGVIDESDGNRFDLEYDVVAFKNGEAAGTFGKVVAGAIPDAALAGIKTAGIAYHASLELAPGQYNVRFVVRDNITGRLGSVSAPLTVN